MAVGEVVRFDRIKGAKSNRSVAETEQLLALPNPRQKALQTTSLKSEAEAGGAVSIVGLVVLACVVLAYCVCAFHLSGQPSYSARANLLPRNFIQF